jgi:serine protease Do
MDQLQKDGTIRRGYLGVQMKDVTDPELAAKLGVTANGGVVVTQVFEGTPGSKGGIREGDVITHLGGKVIHEGRELQMIVAGLLLSKPVQVVVVRDGQPKTLSVTIEEQPADFGTRPAPRAPSKEAPTVPVDKLGLEVTDLTPELAEKLGYSPRANGALIVNVESDSIASQAGLRRGLLITKVDKQPVRSAVDLRSALDKMALEQGVLVQVRTPQGDSSYVLLRKN